MQSFAGLLCMTPRRMSWQFWAPRYRERKTFRKADRPILQQSISSSPAEADEARQPQKRQKFLRSNLRVRRYLWSRITGRSFHLLEVQPGPEICDAIQRSEGCA